MAQATTYLDNALIGHLFRNSALSSPTTVYCALFTVSPTVSGGGSELSTTGSYTRQAITFGPALTGSSANTNVLTFGPASLSWGTITSFAIFDASSAGNMLVFNNLNSSVTVNQGDSLQFISASLGVTIS
jgi:hypothetical protein